MVPAEFLTKTKSNTYVCSCAKINVFVPKYYFDKELAVPMGDIIQTLGIIYLEAFASDTSKPETYKISMPLSLELKFTDSHTEIRQFKDMSSKDEFVVYTTYKNDIVLNKSTHIVNYSSTKLFLDSLMQAKLPENIEYSKIVDMIKANAAMNNMNLGVPSLIIEIMVSELMRDSRDNTIPYRVVAGKTGSEFGYEAVKIKDIPNLSSVFAGLSFENVNEAIMNGLTTSKNNKDQKVSPTEQVLYY